MLNQTNRLIVKMSNLSDEEVEDMRLSLKLDGQVKPLGNLNLAPNETIYDTVNVTIIRTGWHEAELMITDYPVNFDDRYFFAFNVQKEIKVLAINETAANRYLSAAFGNVGYFKVNNEMSNKIDYSKLSEYQLIILNELNTIPSGLAFELKQYITDGGNVGIFPNQNANTATYKSFLNSVGANELTAFQPKKREVTYINVDEFIFNDVFINKNSNLKLPSTTGNFGVTRNRAEEVLLRYRDGGSYISKYVYEGGNLFLSAAPLNKEVNSLVQNGEVFVPLLYKMALATGKDTRIAYVIGKDDVLESDNKITGSEIVYKLKGSAEEFIPGQKALGNKVILNINNQIKTAGFYNLFLEDSETLYKFAFNYDRRESQLAYFSEAELKEKGGQFVDIIEASANADFKELIGERSRGIILWKWCLIAALLFLLAEVLLLRFWKA
jgi:hypothetical protein